LFPEVFCEGVVRVFLERVSTGGSILRVTLDGVACSVFRAAAGVVLFSADLDAPWDAVSPGVTVRDARLLLTEGVRLLEEGWLFVLRSATSTVRFTGCERVALLRLEGADWGGAGCGADCTGRDCEGVGERVARGAVAGVDGRLSAGRDDLDAAGAGSRAGAEGLAAGRDLSVGAGWAFGPCEGWFCLDAAFICGRSADFELDSPRPLRADTGTISSEHINAITTTKMNLLYGCKHMLSLLSLTATPIWAACRISAFFSCYFNAALSKAS